MRKIGLLILISLVSWSSVLFAAPPETASPYKLAGVVLGTHAVLKNNKNEILPQCLYAMLKNPSAICVPSGASAMTIAQQPPETTRIVNADTEKANWMLAAIPPLDANHVGWLYRFDTAALGFRIDRNGIVDEIIVAGVAQSGFCLEGEKGSIKLDDDLRKVFATYSYADSIETYSGQPCASPNSGQMRKFKLTYKLANSAMKLVYLVINNRVVSISLSQ